MNSAKITKSLPIVLILGVILLVLAQYFLYVEIKKTNQRSSGLANEVDLKNNQEEYMISTGKVIQNINNDLSKVHKSIVSQTEDAEFITSIERLAEAVNLPVDINSLLLDVNPKATTSPIVSFKISIKTEGLWRSQYKYLKEIESLPIKTRISYYSLETAGENGNSDISKDVSGKWKSKIDFSVLKYYK